MYAWFSVGNGKGRARRLGLGQSWMIPSRLSLVVRGTILHTIPLLVQNSIPPAISALRLRYSSCSIVAVAAASGAVPPSAALP